MPEPSRNLARNRDGDDRAALGWGYSWPANRRMLYNRASARPDGSPWSESKRWVWWDGDQERWVGYDVPDFPTDKRPDYQPPPGALGLAAHPGDAPFVMLADGRGQLYVASGLRDGPLPTHYEPGAMSRFVPWLAELQPEGFAELDADLATDLGIVNGDWVVVATLRGAIETRALVTDRLRPLAVDGRRLHQVGLPWHFGYAGIARGGIANDLSALVEDPNWLIHEAKAFTCAVRKGRLDDAGAGIERDREPRP